jgi:hypothetical protein
MRCLVVGQRADSPSRRSDLEAEARPRQEQGRRGVDGSKTRVLAGQAGRGSSRLGWIKRVDTRIRRAHWYSGIQSPSPAPPFDSEAASYWDADPVDFPIQLPPLSVRHSG